MTTVIATGKTIEDAVMKGLTELGVSRESVTLNVLEQPSRGFLGLIGVKPAKVELTLIPKRKSESVVTEPDRIQISSLTESISSVSEADPYYEASEFIKEVAAGMGLEVDIDIKKNRDGKIFNITGDNLGLIIGRRGQTLDALQYLANIVANKHSTSFVRIVLDAENFRQRRRKTLEELAERLALQVIRTGKEVILEPMSSQERKVIHAKLQHHRQIKTYSKGEEPNRRVVITPK
ncbi:MULTISPECIES: RNA-binding cell elongation regulator Jag/EloR [unclassified Paenibacillus]|uniref:RNA-binding cell elongation regulator Jag/EloR n=1 Tax=unclassified Paenibacillus TaxID=185978 RepID=UPI00089ABB38|nr:MULTISPECIES: RNA-binding cell elongation regulator Jag/EloR [unclassified Paenibacillus]OMC66119.1 protein jag [Paenibacillus sp. FSL H7-0326]SDW94172.1 spoIIIJ-associated protein [Paenibacillus sp. PDC88]